MQAIYLPGAGIRNQFYDLLHQPRPRRSTSATTRSTSRPVTDNRPFFFYTVQPRDLWIFITQRLARRRDDYKVNKAVPLLFGLMAISLVATALVLLLPPLVLGTRLPRQPGVRGFLLYFLFIGAGYILIEVGLIQKFVLFLGHPTYALTVVIFSMLVSSGLGSFFSRRVLGKSEGRLIKALGAVALLASLLAAGDCPRCLPRWCGCRWRSKMALTVALIAPLGFVMGMPFPTALQRLEEWHAPSVRWAWSLNAAASVLGSVGALVCAIYLGLVQTLIIGGLFYLAALAVVARVRPQHRGRAGAGHGARGAGEVAPAPAYRATISNGMAGSAPNCTRWVVGRAVPLAGVTVRSPTRFTIRLPFRPGLALAASHWSTISVRLPAGGGGRRSRPSGGSLNSKSSLVMAPLGGSNT